MTTETLFGDKMIPETSHEEHVYKVSRAINHLIDTINSVTPVATEDLRLTLHDLANELIANLQLIDSVT